jgi:hypothetical protein
MLFLNFLWIKTGTKKKEDWVWWPTHLIPAAWKQSLEKSQYEASLGKKLVRPNLNH